MARKKILLISFLIFAMLVFSTGAATGLKAATSTEPITATPTQEDTEYYEVALHILYTAVPTVERIVTTAAEGIEAAGLRVVLEGVDFNQLLARLDRGDFEAAFFGFGLGFYPDFLYDFFRSGTATNEYLWRWSNATYDEYVDNMMQAETYEEAVYWAHKAQEILFYEQPIIPIYENIYINAHRNDTWTNFTYMLGSGAFTYLTFLTVRQTSGELGGVFKVSLEYTPEAYNPLVTSSAYSWQILGLIFDGLWIYNPETIEPEPWLAENWTIEKTPEGYLNVTIRLRPDLKWSDGKPLTADDLVFSYWIVNYTQSPVFYDNIRNVIAVNKLDDRTVSVISSVAGFFEFYRVTGVPIMPLHIWGNGSTYGYPEAGVWPDLNTSIIKPEIITSFDPVAEGRLDLLVGCGPFILESIDEEAGVWTMTYNPHFFNLPVDRGGTTWGDEFVDTYKGPYVDKVQHVLYINPEAEVTALAEGEIHLIGGFIDPAYLDLIVDNPNIKIVYTDRRGFGHISFNTRKFPVNMAAFRRAIAWAIDKYKVCEEAWAGFARPIDLPVPPVLGEWSWEDKAPYHYYDSDPEKAREELASVGFADYDNDGWLEWAPPAQPPEQDTMPPVIMSYKWTPYNILEGETVTLDIEVVDNVNVSKVVVSVSYDWWVMFGYPGTVVNFTATYVGDNIWRVTIDTSEVLNLTEDWYWWYWTFAMLVKIYAFDHRNNSAFFGWLVIYIFDSVDMDMDGLPDGWEVNYGLDPATREDAVEDMDGDGLPAMLEYYLGTAPGTPDTDGDGMPDGWEYTYGLDPTDDRDADYDADTDGLTNVMEYEIGTIPTVNDTDADGLLDGDEVTLYETNPLSADTDGDGYTDAYEIEQGSDPTDPEDIPVPMVGVDRIETLDNGTVLIYLTNGTVIKVPPQIVTEEVQVPVTDWTTVGIVGLVEAIVFIGIIVVLMRKKA